MSNVEDIVNRLNKEKGILEEKINAIKIKLLRIYNKEVLGR
ncbi:hypothetical protein [Clostridium sp. JNZ J1-5]|nr:hypothetical protein [Clostridium sp.]